MKGSLPYSSIPAFATLISFHPNRLLVRLFKDSILFVIGMMWLFFLRILEEVLGDRRLFGWDGCTPTFQISCLMDALQRLKFPLLSFPVVHNNND